MVKTKGYRRNRILLILKKKVNLSFIGLDSPLQSYKVRIITKKNL